MATTANSTITSFAPPQDEERAEPTRRGVLFTMTSAALWGGVAGMAINRKREFDAQAYLDGMRALGSRFYLVEDRRSGRTSIGEEFGDSLTDEQTAEMLRLCREYRACPDAKHRVVDVLRREGRVWIVPA